MCISHNNTDDKSDGNVVNLDNELTSFEALHNSNNNVDNNVTEHINSNEQVNAST